MSLAGRDDDQELLQAHLCDPRDPQAITELFRRHRASLWKVSYRTLQHHQDAEDALQEALTRAFRYAESYRGDASVSTWLHRIVLNTARGHRSRRRSLERLVEADEQVEDPSGRQRIEQIDVDHELETALNTLPHMLRDAFLLVAYLEFSVEDVAGMLDIPSGTVKSRVWRARRHLQPLVGKMARVGNP